jgi:hypothetical protein
VKLLTWINDYLINADFSHPFRPKSFRGKINNSMQRILLICLFILGIVSLLGTVGGAIVLAESGSIHPGQTFYRFQYAAESVGASMELNPDRSAQNYLALAQRRIADLTFVAGTDAELQALAFLNADLDRATSAAVNMDFRPIEQLLQIADDLQAALDGLLVVPETNPKLYSAAQDKLTTLRMLIGSRQVAGGDLTRIAMIGLPFPPEIDPILAFIHTFNPAGSAHSFPLVGEHALQECSTCHKGDTYTGLATDCQTCHGQIRPANHFSGDCLSCHSPILWTKVHFDHEVAGATDCLSCHLERRPANHFQAQCSFCHTTRTFKGAKPDHKLAGATDCIACHKAKQPKDHFDRQCSDCHVTVAWSDMSGFSHTKTDTKDCRRCHTCQHRRGAVLGMPQPESLEAFGEDGSQCSDRDGGLCQMPHENPTLRAYRYKGIAVLRVP